MFKLLVLLKGSEQNCSILRVGGSRVGKGSGWMDGWMIQVYSVNVRALVGYNVCEIYASIFVCMLQLVTIYIYIHTVTW